MSPRSDGGQAAILMYHRIADPSDQDAGYSVSPLNFRAHLSQLHDGGFNVVPLQDLTRKLSGGTLPPRSVAITFDDGYVDTLSVAAPMLREFGYPGTVFVVSGVLNGTSEFWWNTVDRVFERARVVPPVLRLQVEGEVSSVPTATTLDKQEARAQVRRILITSSLKERDAVIAELLEWSGAGDKPHPDVRPMTAEELVTLASMPGIEIGAHTASHLWLPSQPASMLLREVTASRRELETLVGRPVTSFAYPYGGHDAAVIDAVRAAGFTVALTTEQRPTVGGDDPLTLPRYEVLNRDALDLDELASDRRGPAA